jgi:hypothetical protein
MKKQRVTLEIVYDETQNSPPMHWNWPMLLDMGGAESVHLVDANPVESAPESETNEDENE